MRTMRRKSGKKVESGVENCFMFDEESPRAENDPSNMSTLTERFKITEFRTDKPYRLSLYVHPSTKRKVNFSDSKIIANLTQIRQNKDKENKPKRVRKTKATKEDVNVTLFEEEDDAAKCGNKCRKLADETPADGEKPNKISKKGILAYVNINESTQKKPAVEEIESKLPKTKPKTVQRAYTKRNKENADSGKFAEPPIEEAFDEEVDSEKVDPNSGDVSDVKGNKKSVKSKDKEDANQNEEFEKWAESINSDFDEIDKFELSITYD